MKQDDKPKLGIFYAQHGCTAIVYRGPVGTELLKFTGRRRFVSSDMIGGGLA
jgi:hypothetical protein